MNADERTPGQQGIGEQRSQHNQANEHADRQQQQQQTPQDGGMSTGQASYGNSGETGTDTLSQDSSSLGQESDLGQTNQSADNRQDGDRSLFRGSDKDMGSTGETDRQDTTGQDFADQGQGALNEDLMGSDEDTARNTDIETERSQGRESDIEGSSL
ncbi:hypothetical protein [Sphingomonas humi]|uniref:Uncharacterized protein n=1 Tax=Sphingomonas humi TaxID=335630 RepID=A0ABP7S1D2_9SPHN